MQLGKRKPLPYSKGYLPLCEAAISLWAAQAWPQVSGLGCLAPMCGAQSPSFKCMLWGCGGRNPSGAAKKALQGLRSKHARLGS